MVNIRTFLILLFCILLSLATHAKDKKVVRLTTGDWLPYTSSHSSGGLLEKIVISAFRTQGYRVEIDYLPWKRSAKLVERSQYDATFPWYSNEERQKKFTYSITPLLHADTLMFYHKDVDFSWNNISDLSQYKIGGVTGFASTKLLNVNGVDTIDTANTKENILKLFRHRVDAIPIAREVGLFMIEEIDEVDLNTIRISEKPLISHPLYMLFSNTDRGRQLSVVFDRGLNMLKESGCYDLLIAGKMCR